jgi:RNA polymerase sigma factor (sigma-70 family)
MPQYLRDHAIYYAGPAKTPAGYASGSFGPTTAGRMDSYVEQFQAAGGSLVMLAKGNRSRQETVLQTIRNLGSFEPQREGALLGYLRRSLLNRIRDRFRYAARHPTPAELDELIADGGASPLALAIEEEDRRHYQEALGRLAPGDREAIVGRIELGYSYEQLAFVLKKPTPGAARVAVRRALLRLSDEMRCGR